MTHKTRTIMPKLTSILKINGSLEGMTFYYLPGVEQPIVRATWGPSKEDIATKRQYARTRENLSESSGRGKAVSGLMKAFQPLKPLADPDTAGQLNRLLRAVQIGDTVSQRGQRAVFLSRYPALLEGFKLTRALPFDEVVRGELPVQMDRAALQASVELPGLRPRLTFFPPAGYAYCRLVAVLGMAPDLVYDPQMYQPQGDFSNCFAQSAHTDWFAAGVGTAATTLSLQLPYSPPSEAFALVLTVGVQLGVPGATGAIEPVRKRLGSARILAAV